jgi:DNA-binding transcriptional ArsR family regulator
MGGLSSGEGLIWAVRDPIREPVPIKEKGKTIRYEKQITDEGEADKRLLVTEPEFASVLQRAERETNTLSAIIRQAWDSGSLRVLKKKQTAQATDALISIIGHITRDELRRLLSSTEAANGFANRFLWVCARRSKCLPDGGALDQVDFSDVIQRLQEAATFAKTVQEMHRDCRAGAIWHEVYNALSEGEPGLFGAVTSRAEAQVLRLSCLYALLDCSPVVRAEHLRAALAVWEYCENSARFIFGAALGDPTADEILRALRGRAEGMTRNEIREHFGRNKLSAEMDRALSVLQEYGRARMVKEPAEQGRPAERWYAIDAINAVSPD